MMPEVMDLLLHNDTFKGSGGWLQGSAENLIKYTDVNLSVAIVNRQINKFTKLQGNSIKYYLIPYEKGFDYISHCYDRYWKAINTDLEPDVVHVHGVESTLALSYIKAISADNVVVSIQGLAGVISKYFYAGLRTIDLLRSISIRDILTLKPVFYYKNDFHRRGYYENETIRSVKYIIGRTSWDRAHVLCENSEVRYFHCNETLRSNFYEREWKFENCLPHSIFLSHAAAPFKGAHQLLEAMQYILPVYPDTIIRIAGHSLSLDNSFNGLIRRTGYENYIRKLIRKNNLEDHIIFLGALSSEQMLEEYLKANIFICPSTIENSSNSVSEAQMLGVPLIASYVGGTPDMIPNEQCGILFRVGEHEMLAQAIMSIFRKSQSFNNSEMRHIAHKRHDQKNNAEQTYQIYKTIANNNQ